MIMRKSLCCVIILLLSACSMSTPSTTTEKFVMAMAQGDKDKALSYMHIPDDEHHEENSVFVKEVVLPPLMRKVYAAAVSKGGVLGVQVQEIDKDNGHATVLYKILFANGENMEGTLSLQKAFHWRVIR